MKQRRTKRQGVQKHLMNLYDLCAYREKLLDDIEKYVGTKAATKAHVDFLSWSPFTIRYISNIDWYREAAAKYATGRLKVDDKYARILKNHLKMEHLRMSVDNEYVGVLDDITRAHSVLNKYFAQEGEIHYPETKFHYPNTLGESYKAWFNTLKNDTF